jgi:TPR repeat protein
MLKVEVWPKMNPRLLSGWRQAQRKATPGRSSISVRWLDQLVFRAVVAPLICTLTAGAMYAGGRGVAKDESKAVKFWEAAAAQGFVQAQFNLGTDSPQATVMCRPSDQESLIADWRPYVR